MEFYFRALEKMTIFAHKMGIPRDYIAEFLRFGLVGCMAVVIQYATYCGVLILRPHNIAYTIGYLVSFLANYVMTTLFTFKSKRTVGNGFGFALCHIINFFMQIGLLNLFIYYGFSKVYAPIPVYAICVPTNFLLVRQVMKGWGNLR